MHVIFNLIFFFFFFVSTHGFNSFIYMFVIVSFTAVKELPIQTRADHTKRLPKDKKVIMITYVTIMHFKEFDLKNVCLYELYFASYRS